MFSISSSFYTLIILLSCEWSDQCFGGGGGPKKKTTPGPTTEGISNHGVGNKAPIPKDMWNGWNAPPGVPNFTTYMAAYQKKLAKIQKKNGIFGAMTPKGIGPNFPKEWIGYGPGQGGNPPPPWAFVPLNTGKPAFCFEQPLSGDCPDNYPKTRYGYNPFTDECQEFDFVCHGNQNNFKTKEKCEEMCMGGSETACNTDSMLTFDDL